MKLRGLFASMMWLPMVESEKLPRNALAECVKANVSNDSLIVNLCASKVDDAHLSLLAGSMHNHLSRVDLNFCMCSKLTGKGVEDLCRHMPQKLKTLKLNFKQLGQKLETSQKSIPFDTCGHSDGCCAIGSDIYFGFTLVGRVYGHPLSA